MDRAIAPKKSEIIAKSAEVNGIVQGVGFRPYVYRLAQQHTLQGQVANTGDGVAIIVEGPPGNVAAFFNDLPASPPPLAHITGVAVSDCAVVGFDTFSITASKSKTAHTALISPDVAVCDDCLREMLQPTDRRYGYPFINCTNCGPRYTIIDDVPYDRPKTAMRDFLMCDRCQAEYDDPGDRRYHAQPNACPQCGPRVTLLDQRGEPVETADPIARTAEALKAGQIVAIKGLGGFHLSVDAFNDAAVVRLRARKHREEKPLAVMAPDLAAVASFAQMTEADTQLLQSIQRPIVLLPKRLPERLAFPVSPRNHYYGVMLPYTPLHYLLMAHGFTALVMTSGNLSEEPIAIDNHEAVERLGNIADVFLVHDRPIRLRSDDSIVRNFNGKTRQIRRSRGFVPVPVFLKGAQPMVLACGAELKNTICLTKENRAFVSQHIGDLENLATESFFHLTIDHLQRILDISPQAVACDLHPDYISSRWARGRTDLPVIEVQHHHAHIAACMAEHQLEETVIGLAFDGTGFGPDKTVWGGEALLADLSDYKRVAHLACVPMPGSAAAIKAPWRMALSYLHHAFGEELWGLDFPFIQQMNQDKARLILQMIDKRLNTPMTSSMGRLFDGVAAIIGLRRQVAFEGQAAIELEMIADGNEQGVYPFEINDGQVRQVDPGPTIKAVVADIQARIPAFIISRRFHDTLVALWAKLCADLRAETGLDRVVLSGGCFQNVLLLDGLTRALQQDGFQVYSHSLVPANDGGIALGQAVVAGKKCKSM